MMIWVLMVLLDTSVLIWLLNGSSRIGTASRQLVESSHPVYYSSVSVLEMLIKKMKGKLSVSDDLCPHFDSIGLRQMPLTGEHAEALAEFTALAGHDPFDRALLAQAKAEGLRFVTADRRLLDLGHEWIIDATK